MDNLTRDQRSFCMSRVRSRDTGIEVLVRSELHRRGMRFRKHCGSLPGRPDVVFSAARVAVFVDGDFWHGYRFPAWRERLSDYWAAKIAANRARDRRTFRRLRRIGWRVVRIWQHEIEANVPACIDRVEAAVRAHDEQRACPIPDGPAVTFHAAMSSAAERQSSVRSSAAQERRTSIGDGIRGTEREELSDHG